MVAGVSDACSTRAAAFEGRAAVGVEGEEVSISAVPAATHLPLSVTSHYCDTNTTCALEYDLYKSRGGGISFPVLFKKWKTG